MSHYALEEKQTDIDKLKDGGNENEIGLEDGCCRMVAEEAG